MGLLDGILKQVTGGQSDASGLAGLMEMVSKNPKILTALTSLLSTQTSAAGGSGGLAGLMGAFQKAGMGDMMSSWVSTGPNPPISEAQLTNVVGKDAIGKFASDAGVPESEAGSLLANLLPAAINHLTPDGKMPESLSLEGGLTSMLSGFGK